MNTPPALARDLPHVPPPFTEIADVATRRVAQQAGEGIINMANTHRANRETKSSGGDMLTILGKLVGERSVLGLVGLTLAYVLWKQYLGLLESSEKKWEANAISLEKRVEEAKTETRLFSQIVAANTAQSSNTENRLISIEKTIERIRP